MTYTHELGPIRPVDEADSLLIRTTRGCPWNKCEFCVNYQDTQFSIRSVEEIKADIEKAANYFNQHPFTTCFLQDGDSFAMKTSDLLVVLEYLKQHFPNLQRISSYGRAQTMIRKSKQELQELCQAGLNKLYCGMESGSDIVLRNIRKGTRASDIVTSAQAAKEAGMVLSEFIILGLGGKEHWEEHATATAEVLNKIDPDHIRVLTIGIKPGSGLEQKLINGSFQLQTEKNIIEEQRMLIENLDDISADYVNHHAVDLLTEARGQLPYEKPKLLAIMDRYLALNEADMLNFTLGRRLGNYQRLDDLQDVERYEAVNQRLHQIESQYPGQIETIFHSLRSRVV